MGPSRADAGGGTAKEAVAPAAALSQPLCGFTPVPGTYQAGAWSHALSFEPTEARPDGEWILRITYRGETVEPRNSYDRLRTPWGVLLAMTQKRWVPVSGGFGGHNIPSLTYEEMTKGRDVTPADAEPIRPAEHPTVDEVVADCVRGLSHEAWDVRMMAIGILHHLGPAAGAATQALARVVEDRRPEAPHAVEALGFIGPAAHEALPVIERAAAHPDCNVRAAVAWAAARVSGFSSQVVPLLESLAKDPDERVQQAATSALEAVKAASAKQAPAAGAPKQDPFYEIRSSLHRRTNGVRLVAAASVSGTDAGTIEIKWSLDYEGPRPPLVILAPGLENATNGQTQVLVYAQVKGGKRADAHEMTLGSPVQLDIFWVPKDWFLTVEKGKTATGAIPIRVSDIRKFFVKNWPERFKEDPPPEVRIQMVHKPTERGQEYALDAWTGELYSAVVPIELRKW